MNEKKIPLTPYLIRIFFTKELKTNQQHNLNSKNRKQIDTS